jgi:branched-subunit amino acid aminotransferase/4-amino-4-deoxychorismate lyase
MKWNMKYIIRELTRGGFETRLFYSAQADEVYLKLRTPYDRLMREADRINLKLPLHPVELKKLLLTGRREGNKVSQHFHISLCTNPGTLGALGSCLHSRRHTGDIFVSL